MVSIIVSFGMILLLFLSGRIYESIKRLLMLITDVILKSLNIFGIKINTKEYRIKTSYEFKQTFKDIKIVKKSKENKKIKPSINLIALIMLLISIVTVIINLNIVSGNIISVWLFEHNLFPLFIKSQESMDATLTAILFSVIAFSISKLINQWKETAKFRNAKKEMCKREKLLCKMSAKELLDIVKQKDLDGYMSHLKEEPQNNINKDDDNSVNDESRVKTKKHKQKEKRKRSKIKEEKSSNARNF